MTGREQDGVPLIERGLVGHRESGANMDRPYYLGLLAEAHERAGRPKQADEALDEALALVDSTRRFFHDAELLRAKARLALLGGRRGEAANLLERSLLTAKAQGNRMAELRALTALASIGEARGGHRQALRRLCDGMAEASPDVAEARALLHP